MQLRAIDAANHRFTQFPIDKIIDPEIFDELTKNDNNKSTHFWLDESQTSKILNILDEQNIHYEIKKEYSNFYLVTNYNQTSLEKQV
jgi:hypothetical protein